MPRVTASLDGDYKSQLMNCARRGCKARFRSSLRLWGLQKEKSEKYRLLVSSWLARGFATAQYQQPRVSAQRCPSG